MAVTYECKEKNMELVEIIIEILIEKQQQRSYEDGVQLAHLALAHVSHLGERRRNKQNKTKQVTLDTAIAIITITKHLPPACW